MLPTFSVNQEPQKEFMNIILKVCKGRTLNPQELSDLSGYALRKAYKEINYSFETYKHVKVFDEKRELYRSEKQKEYIPDMISIEEQPWVIEDLKFSTSIEEEKLDDAWAVKYIINTTKEWFIEKGISLLRLLQLGLQGDAPAVEKLKGILKEERFKNKKNQENYSNLKYAIGLCITTDYIKYCLKMGLIDDLCNKYGVN